MSGTSDFAPVREKVVIEEAVQNARYHPILGIKEKKQ